MIITDVKIRIIKDRPKLKAIACIVIDNSLAINDLKIIQSKRLFVSFPRHEYAAMANLQLIVPLNGETRQMIEKVVIDKYLNLAEK